MKKILLSSAALAMVLVAGSAVAADLPAKKAPVYIPPPPVMTWTGFYVGLNAGYTFGNSNATTFASAPLFGNAGLAGGLIAQFPTSLAIASSGVANTNSDGFIGGGQVGYNWQIMNNFVVGVEADIQGIAKSGGNSSLVTASGPVAVFVGNSYLSVTNVGKSLDYLGTVRGRLGYLFTPSLLVYGTGGLAYGGVNSSISTVGFVTGVHALNPAFGSAAFSDTRVGWTAGGGLEWMFMPNWSAKVEYLYYDLGNVSTPLTVSQTNNVGTLFAVTAGAATTRFDGHIVRAGVNYHFNWGAAPVVAKY